MRLHILFIASMLALSACDSLPTTGGAAAVIAKGPSTLHVKHEKHVLMITVGSLVAYSGEAPFTTTYRAPYSVATEVPFVFENRVVLTCNVRDEDGDLVGGAALQIGQAPTGGIFEFGVTRLISSGNITCDAADAKGFTAKVFP